jgi:hypothetical protein
MPTAVERAAVGDASVESLKRQEANVDSAVTLVGALAAWLILQLWLLSRLGVPT